MTLQAGKITNKLVKVQFLYQDPIESGGRSSTLHVTEHGDARVLLQVVYHHLLHQLSGDRLALAVDRPFGDDDDVQTLARLALLRITQPLLQFNCQV